MTSFKIDWIDHFREPECAPDARYPHGIDLDITLGTQPSCKADLPYPAKRCGLWAVTCKLCGYTIAITTAGRPDDPRSVCVPCLPRFSSENEDEDLRS